MYSSCTCMGFTNNYFNYQHLTTIRKHLYYLFQYSCKIDTHEDKFIYAPSYSFNDLNILLVKTETITVSVFGYKNPGKHLGKTQKVIVVISRCFKLALLGKLLSYYALFPVLSAHLKLD